MLKPLKKKIAAAKARKAAVKVEVVPVSPVLTAFTPDPYPPTDFLEAIGPSDHYRTEIEAQELFAEEVPLPPPLSPTKAHGAEAGEVTVHTGKKNEYTMTTVIVIVVGLLCVAGYFLYR